MKSEFSPARWWKPMIGVATVAFVAGACVRQNLPAQQTPLSAAQAQTPKTGNTIRHADELAKLSTTFADIAEKVTPAVVNIQSETTIPGRIFRDPFADFFGGGGGMMREPDHKEQSLGSGVIVDKSGLIVTNNHVIKGATTITVTLSDKRRFRARRLGADPDTDVAVLKIDAQNLPTLQWADSDKLQVGEIVLAIGSPFNLSSTVTQGILSGKGRRDLGISAYEDFLQTDAAINPGNSGGALVDIDGNLIGINTAILSTSGGPEGSNQGIGFAIPAKLARRIASQLVTTGQVTRGWLGMVVEPVTEDEAKELGLDSARGVNVTGIYTRGPAGTLPWSRNGNDVILKVNDQAIDTPGQLRNMVEDVKPGDSVTLDVWQNGRTQKFTLQASRRPPQVQGV